MDAESVLDLVSEIFEEEALLLDEVFSEGGVSDETAWNLVRALHRLRRKYVRKLSGVGPSRLTAERGSCRDPHPAIEHFLRSVREDTAARRTTGAGT